MLNNDLPRRFYFCKDVFIWIIPAVRPMHGENPASTVFELTDTERIGETSWPPPPRQTFRLERGKDLLERCRDFTRCLECGHRSLEELDGECYCVAAAEAQGRDAAFQFAALEFV